MGAKQISTDLSKLHFGNLENLQKFKISIRMGIDGEADYSINRESGELNTEVNADLLPDIQEVEEDRQYESKSLTFIDNALTNTVSRMEKTSLFISKTGSCLSKLLPNRCRINCCIVTYFLTVLYLVYSIFFVYNSEYVHLKPDMPQSCSDFNNSVDDSYCAIVNFDGCESYKELMINGTNHFETSDSNIQPNLPLQSFYSFFKGLNVTQFFDTDIVTLH
jgi:hypothetical protein